MTHDEAKDQSHRSAVQDEAGDSLDLLTPEEAAALLRVQPRTLANWRGAKGRKQPLPFVRASGGAVRYRRADLVAFVNARIAVAA